MPHYLDIIKAMKSGNLSLFDRALVRLTSAADIAYAVTLWLLHAFGVLFCFMRQVGENLKWCVFIV